MTINDAGQVQVSLDGQTAPTTVGTIQLAMFPNEAGLEAQGDNLLLQSRRPAIRRPERPHRPASAP